MKLIDLDPEWLSEDVFVFRSPGGYGDLITCKRIPMTFIEQQKLVYKDNPKYVGQVVVMTEPGFAWKFDGNDFDTMTVHPSIDCSSSGNWHGFIKNGDII